MAVPPPFLSERPSAPFATQPLRFDLELITPFNAAGAANEVAQREDRDRKTGRVRQEARPGVSAQRVGAEGLRPASVRAALRFWWRAAQDPGWDTRRLATAEAGVFGPAPGRPRLALRTSTGTWTVASGSALDFAPASEFGYLAFGCADHAGALRPSVMPGSRAVLEIAVADVGLRDEVGRTVARWLLFGGLGGRMRRGWGSFQLADGAFADRAALVAAIRSELAAGDPEAPRWSNLHGARVLLDRESRDWQEALEGLGRVLRRFRKRLGADLDPRNDFQQRKGQPYGPDHNRAWNWLTRPGAALMDPACDAEATLPERIGFGLPHHARFRRGHGEIHFEALGRGLGGRRASPVLLRVHRLADGRHIGQVLILGGRFLPENARIRYHNAGSPRRDGHDRSIEPDKAGYRVGDLDAPVWPTVLESFLSHCRSQRFTEIRP